jgi:tetratricopeptide (TPR) repeat protein
MKVSKAKSTPAQQKPSRSWERPAFLYLFLAAITILVFLPVKNFQFTGYDDPDYVTENNWVQRGLTWGGIRWSLQTLDANNWHPVTWLSHMLDTELTGYTASGPHVTNLILHTANSLLLMFLLQTMTGAVWRSGIVAVLFALHPLHVESVAWVSERKDVLSTFFGLLCLLAYSNYAKAAGRAISGKEMPSTASTRRCAWVYYLIALFSFTLGLMSKPMLVTWPFLMLLLDYWPLHRAEENLASWVRLLREKVPFFVLSAVGCMMTVVAQKKGGAIAAGSALSMSTRIGNAFVSYFRYLKKALWPSDLIIPYPYPKDDWPLVLVIACVIILVGVSILVLRWRRRFPFFTMGWFWYVGMLVPVIGILQVGGQSMADRYTYVPLVGIFIVVVWGVAEVIERRQLSVRLPLVASTVVVVSLYATITMNQLQYWRNSETLFRHTLSVTPANGIAHLHVGRYLLESGQEDKAIEQYLEAMKVLPGNIHALAGIGSALTKTKRYPEAIEFLQTAIRNSPDFPKAHYELGTVYSDLGQMDKAMEYYKKATKLSPENAVAHYRLGNALMKVGRIDDAITEYIIALHYQPGNVDTLNNLGAAYLAKRQLDLAAAQFTLALRHQPENLNARFNLGNAFAMQEKWKDACEQYLAAAELAPANPAIQYGCGLAFARLGQREKAVQHLTEAMRLNPSDPKARRELQALH